MQRVIRSLLAWAILAGPAPALAAPLVPVGPVGFATDHFRLAGGPDGVFDVEGGALPPGVAWSTGCWAGGAGESLEGAEDGRPLTGVSASVSVMGMAGLSVQTSVALDGGGAGDTRVAPKLPLLGAGGHGVRVAFTPAFVLPTGSHGSYLGDGLLAWAPEVAVSKRLGGLRLAANAGYLGRPDQEAAGVRVGRELTARVGAAWRPGVADLETALTLRGAKSLREGAASGADVFLGIAREIVAGLSGFAGGGGALVGRRAGTPSWRALVGVRWMAGGTDDVVADAPPDRDGDGLADADDRCPDDPEDPDGRFDDDGCPDFDDDKDGVPDVADACPERSGEPESRGCPPLDGDGDGLVDREDNCPTVQGTFHGCTTPQIVRMRRGHIDLLQPMTFEPGSAEMTEATGPLLDAIKGVLQAHPEIHLLRVEGHTDDRGNRAHNVSLSQDRALAVADALAARGVSPSRLSAVGYGPARPVESNATEAGRAANRRVDLIIAAATPALPADVVDVDAPPDAPDEGGVPGVPPPPVDEINDDLGDVLGSIF